MCPRKKVPEDHYLMYMYDKTANRFVSKFIITK